MSILACLIGILTLMISVMLQVQQMERQGQTQEEMDRAIANRDLKKKSEQLEEKLVALELKMKQDHSSLAEMKKLKDQQIVLKLKLDEITQTENADQSNEELQKKVENLKLEIAALKLERPPLKDRLNELKLELKSRKDAPKPKESVVVRPRGFGARAAKNIFFVECNSTGIVLREGNKIGESVSTAAIASNASYSAFLNKVKKTRDSMVLFLIRKSGNDAYLWAAGLAETKFKVTTGKLPIPNDGEIDLSLFK